MSLSRRDLMLGGVAALGLAACSRVTETAGVGVSDTGTDTGADTGPDAGAGPVERFEARLDAVLDPSARLETLADGFQWSEGPAWDRDRDCLYFTDVPGNVAWRWSDADGLERFLDPSGAAGEAEGFREAGANGLWYEGEGRLLVCNHGTRSVERLDIASGARETLAERYQGRRFNSPNDLVRAGDGTIYFTDPPYGLEGLDASPLKEMAVNGVYRLRPGGEVERLVEGMSFPNGIALSPDGRALYVAQSDPEAPVIRRWTIGADGALSGGEVWFDAAAQLGADRPGLPDGMAVAADGTVFATGPGGVFVLAADGTVLGRIDTGRATANCAFGGDGLVLYITAHDRLMRIATRVRGLAWAS